MIERFSQLTLDLYRAVTQIDSSQFRDWTLHRLREDIEFDSAIWIQGILVENIPITNNVFLHDLPSHLLQDYAHWASRDTVFEAVMCNPGRCILMRDTQSMAAWYKSEMYQKYTSKYHIEDVAAIMIPFASSGIQTFISLYRSRRDNPFSERERSFVQAISPLLVEAENLNVIRHVRHHHGTADMNGAIAVVSTEGHLKMAEVEFIQLMDAGWPNWEPPQIPLQLLRFAKRPKPDGQILDKYFLKSVPSSEGWVISIRPVFPLDLLTAREREIATRIADGMPYKQVANELSIAKSTVTNHVNAIYVKLSVTSGAGLRKLLIDNLITHP